MATKAEPSIGVQALIDRLRAEGIDDGRREASALLEEAKRKAEEILAKARAEADVIVERGQSRAAEIEAATRDGLRLAARDAILDLKAQITEQFRLRLERLVSLRMRETEFTERLILEIAGRARREILGDLPIEVLLPRAVVDLDDLHEHPESIREGTLTHFALTLSTEMLREGVTLKVRADEGAGLRIRLMGEAIEVDLTEETVEAILLAHLLPRFRALLEGIIH
ncbi:MAG: hypothetical protein KC466_15430 [Myxococcales bacterium]|nr:hypothetical protein [Myxococcales bacterium]